MGQPTIKDVAKLAGVSISTVSRVMNNSKPVSPEARRKVVDAILEVSEYHRFSKGIFSFVGFNTYYLPYEVEERKNGTSKWSFWKLFNYAIEGIVAFTTTPLRIPFIFSFKN